MSDPIRYYGSIGIAMAEDRDLNGLTTPGWYFWDETWSYAYGPHETREAASKACAEYAKQLEKPKLKRAKCGGCGETILVSEVGIVPPVCDSCLGVRPRVAQGRNEQERWALKVAEHGSGNVARHVGGSSTGVYDEL